MNSVQTIEIRNLTNQRVISDKCTVAKRFWTRLRGLIGRTSLETGEGMLFPECNNIHMWFMRIPIDVVFLGDEVIRDGKSARRVTSVHERVKPWRILPLMDWRAKETLELPAGTIRREEIKAGDEICIG